MGIGKGENKTTWDDFLKSQQGSQAKKGSNKVSGSGASGKDKEAEKNGGGTEGATGANEAAKE
ncbi:hypothetical protein NCY59_03425 [Acinetobacter radioresistens]|uniref:hypothetical protein n=1 Tax=Acinetobacter radioresistens TaxID=40216 RepID=UPI002030505E|nr:hypothetical protein [Acinetobacter radioresistens]MCM1934622.1 hypothetical protein [Acinetobacter radioresistens]MCM1952091.1 hypothetical protein [Acinetobacter radioresistens]